METKQKMNISYITKLNSTIISNKNKKIAGRRIRSLCKEVEKSPYVDTFEE